ncbi:Os06g0538650 [Oryza sativa Japonica Group]|uniref:Os06g0538650 protein n=1 Tax=Oryza sativa subsp. japonica TaxID=39947 RepID=A0A0N7KM85_ORYSJ|nr:Os06g0538650 [Oryza sativa Japonica Group]
MLAGAERHWTLASIPMTLRSRVEDDWIGYKLGNMVRRMLVATTRSSKAFYRRWVEDAGCWWSGGHTRSIKGRIG